MIWSVFTIWTGIKVKRIELHNLDVFAFEPEEPETKVTEVTIENEGAYFALPMVRYLKKT